MMVKRKLLIYIMAGIMSVTIGCMMGGIIYYRQDQADKNAFRCHFVELLKPGMRLDEVEQVLSQFGAYHINKDRAFGPNFIVGISYIDPPTNERFGGYFVIEFYNYVYFGIYRPRGSDGDDILLMCDE